MAKDINLLPDVTLAEEKELRLKKLLTLISVSAMLLSIVGLIVVFATQIFFQRELNTVTEKNNRIREELQEYTQLELDYRAYKSKLTAIGTIRKEAINQERYVSKITELLPSGIEITTLQITDQLITSVNGKADSSESIHNFVKNLIAEGAKADGYFTNVGMDNLSLDQEGNFQFRISMTAKKYEQK